MIFCGHVAGNYDCNDEDTFSTLGLPWKYHGYYRTDFFPGTHATAMLGLPQLSYNVKATVLGDVAASDIVYGPTEQSYTQSLVFAPECVADSSGAAAALGRGWVGYVGDVNGEDNHHCEGHGQSAVFGWCW